MPTPNDPEPLVHNLNTVRARLTEACQRASRTPGSVRLVAASKEQPPEKVRALHEAGVTWFGENYASELLDKAEQLHDLNGLRWSFIGALQSNKIRRLVERVHEIQTLASEKHARYVARYAEEAEKTPFPVFISVNAAEESSKTGVALDDVASLAERIQSLPALDLRGIMTIPPPLDQLDPPPPGEAPELYQALGRLAAQTGAGELSLGMSGDLAEAVAAGSTCVRIGTALFGPRPSAANR